MTKKVNRLQQADFYRVCRLIEQMADDDKTIEGTRTSIAARVGNELNLVVPVSTVKKAMEITDVHMREELTLAYVAVRLKEVEDRLAALEEAVLQ